MHACLPTTPVLMLFAFLVCCLAAVRGQTWFEIVSSLLQRTRVYFENAAAATRNPSLKVNSPLGVEWDASRLVLN